MVSSEPDHHNVSPPPDFTTGQGRLYLYQVWIQQRFAEGTILKDKSYTREERTAFLADWLRYLVARKILNPRHRLPSYAMIAPLFQVRTQEVAQVIRDLRDEKVLPPRKTRRDAKTPQWTDRDHFLWGYIGHMRALRFDQMRRLAARASEYQIEGRLLSVSRTSEIVERWVREKIAIYRRVYHAQSGWIHLTRKGLREAGLDFRAEAPSSRTLHHLYWITEVRMHLEDEYNTSEMQWMSERSIQAQQEQRKAGQKLLHIQDGILVLRGTDGQKRAIDIEVQVSKPAPDEVQEVMSDQFRSHSENRPLRYYINRQSRGVVQAVYQKMVRERRATRPSIEIIDLETWQPLLPPP